MTADEANADRVDELMAQVAQLRAEVHALQQRRPPAGALDAQAAPSSTRRAALRLGGAGAAAAVAGVMAGSTPAHADDPNDVVKNVTNTVTATTQLSGAVNAPILTVTNTGTTHRGLLATSQGQDVAAIRGDNSNSAGVGGVGVGGFALGGRDLFAFGSGRIAMVTHAFSLANNTYTAGEIHHSSGTLWTMITPTTRRAIAGPATAGALFPINPVRVYDSRRPAPNPGVLAGGANRVVSVADARDEATGAVVTANVVPAGATAIVFNLTIANTTGGGFLAITAGSAAGYSASHINWNTAGVVAANASIVPLDSLRQVRVFAGGSGSTHFIIDISGYYL